MNSNTITIIIATLAIMGGAYWYFFTDTGNEPTLSEVSETGNEAQMQFQVLVSTLQPISFSTSIFEDSRFMALVDLSTPIESETAGRLDPFAPMANSALPNTPVKNSTGR